MTDDSEVNITTVGSRWVENSVNFRFWGCILCVICKC